MFPEEHKYHNQQCYYCPSCLPNPKKVFLRLLHSKLVHCTVWYNFLQKYCVYGSAARHMTWSWDKISWYTYVMTRYQGLNTDDCITIITLCKNYKFCHTVIHEILYRKMWDMLQKITLCMIDPIVYITVSLASTIVDINCDTILVNTTVTTLHHTTVTHPSKISIGNIYIRFY